MHSFDVKAFQQTDIAVQCVNCVATCCNNEIHNVHKKFHSGVTSPELLRNNMRGLKTNTQKWTWECVQLEKGNTLNLLLSQPQEIEAEPHELYAWQIQMPLKTTLGRRNKEMEG